MLGPSLPHAVISEPDDKEWSGNSGIIWAVDAMSINPNHDNRRDVWCLQSRYRTVSDKELISHHAVAGSVLDGPTIWVYVVYASSRS